MLRIVLATLFCWGFALFLGYIVADGLRSGRIRHSDSSSFVARAKNPAGFWALVAFFLAFIAVALAV